MLQAFFELFPQKETLIQIFICKNKLVVSTLDLPDKAAGMPCTWMGVGFLMPLASKALTRLSGNFISRKLQHAGGTSSPSTRILRFLRIISWTWSGSERIQRGALQLVLIGSLYWIPVACVRKWFLFLTSYLNDIFNLGLLNSCFDATIPNNWVETKEPLHAVTFSI